MRNDIFRILCGLISIAAGIFWSIFLLLSGGEFVARIQSPSSGPLSIALTFTLFAAALGCVSLFAAGIMSMRVGPPRPRLWLACIVAGLVTCLAAWWLTAPSSRLKLSISMSSFAAHLVA